MQQVFLAFCLGLHYNKPRNLSEGGVLLKRKLSILLVIALFLCQLCAPVAADSAEVTKEAVYAALYEADISAVRSALDNGLVTSVELTEYYLNRILKYDEPYNCFITVCDDALQIAAERDRKLADGTGEGLLFGVPIVIKDNMDLTGYHTTNGFYKKASQIAKTDAFVVQRLLEEGAVIIAKANMSTQAQDAKRSISQVAGETRNAYNTGLAAGGSSGGSAVSVSLNFATASLGTDTNSSLRIPAALAGCVSLRPTFGSISVEGIKRLNSTRDVPGAITRSVYDQAIMLDVLTDRANHYTENLNGNVLKGMRIGILKQLTYAVGSGERAEKNLDKEVQAAFQNAVEQLRACGAEVVEISIPKLFNLSDKTFASGDVKYKDALYAEFQSKLESENLSAVIYPTYLSAPLRSGKDSNGKNWTTTSQVNINNCRTLSPCASIPEISIPIGYHSRGAGMGMEVAALRGQEQLLLDIAYSFTNANDFRKAPDGAPNDYADAYMGDLEELITIINTPETVPQETEGEKETLPQETEADVENIPAEEKDPADDRIVLYVGIGVIAILLIIIAILLRIVVVRKRRAKKRQRQRIEL